MEEYESQAGELKTVNKLREFRSIDKVDNIKIPKVKKLDNSYVDYEEYINSKIMNHLATLGILLNLVKTISHFNKIKELEKVLFYIFRC